MDKATLYAPIVKADKQPDGTLLVQGIATDSTLDVDEQRCDPEWLKQAMPRWFTWGNIREMHGPIAAGVATHYEEKDGAHHIVARIVDPNSVKKIEAGVLQGFSIGIRSPRIRADKSAPGGILCGGEVVEVSVVDRPANPACSLTLAKSARPGMVVKGDSLDVDRMLVRVEEYRETPDADADAVKGATLTIEEAPADPVDPAAPFAEALMGAATEVPGGPTATVPVDETTDVPADLAAAVDEAIGDALTEGTTDSGASDAPVPGISGEGDDEGEGADAPVQHRPYTVDEVRAAAHGDLPSGEPVVVAQDGTTTPLADWAAPEAPDAGNGPEAAAGGVPETVPARPAASVADDIARQAALADLQPVTPPAEASGNAAVDALVDAGLAEPAEAPAADESAAEPTGDGEKAAGVDVEAIAVRVAEILGKRDYSPKQRERMSADGRAMAGGGFPIASVKDLRNAIQAIGRAKDPAAAKRHIIARAEALGREDLIPDGWRSDGADKAPGSDVMAHDPQVLAEVRNGLLNLIIQEAMEALQGEREEFDLQMLLEALGMFLAWWDHEAWEGEAPNPSETKGVTLKAEHGPEITNLPRGTSGVVAMKTITLTDGTVEIHAADADVTKAAGCGCCDDCTHGTTHGTPATEKTATPDGDPVTETPTPAEGEGSTTAEHDTVKAAVAEAVTPLLSEVERLTARLAEVEKQAAPGGPVRSRVSTTAQPAPIAGYEHRVKALQYRATAKTITDPEIVRAYERMAEAEDALAAKAAQPDA